MLIMRAEQIKVLEQSVLRGFECEMLEHLKAFAPWHFTVIGEDGTRNVVRLGLQRARAYGLTNRGPARFYIELMYLFGSDFDTDPQLPWTGWILNGAWISGQMERAEQLHAKTMHYLEHTAGPGNIYALNALRRLRAASVRGVPGFGGTFEEQLVTAMQAAYPEKCAYLGELPLLALIKEQSQAVAEYKLADAKAITLFVALAFVMGHGFADDPLFPWISKTLRDSTIADPRQRVERLRVKAITYLNHALSNLEKR